MYLGWELCAGGGLPFRQIQFLHLNQPGVQHLVRNLTSRHASSLGYGHKGAFDVGMDCD